MPAPPAVPLQSAAFTPATPVASSCHLPPGLDAGDVTPAATANAAAAATAATVPSPTSQLVSSA